MTKYDRFNQEDYLLSLAEEIGCETDSDLVFIPSSGAQMIFKGRKKTSWVHFVNAAEIEVKPTVQSGHTGMIVNLTDPKCLERMEQWFHEDSK